MDRAYAKVVVGRIGSLCKKRNLNLNQLSEMSGVSHSTLENLMKMKTLNPRIMTLHKVAIAFNMTLAEFLDFQELNEYSFDDTRTEDQE